MSKPPRTFLGATTPSGEDFVPITKIELEHGVSAGIYLRLFGEGIVSLFEEQENRLERNIDLETWANMPPTEKALIVAMRRIRTAMHNLQSEAEIKNSEKNAKRDK
jgi:hypothetical protein